MGILAQNRNGLLDQLVTPKALLYSSQGSFHARTAMDSKRISAVWILRRNSEKETKKPRSPGKKIHSNAAPNGIGTDSLDPDAICANFGGGHGKVEQDGYNPERSSGAAFPIKRDCEDDPRGNDQAEKRKINWHSTGDDRLLFSVTHAPLQS